MPPHLHIHQPSITIVLNLPLYETFKEQTHIILTSVLVHAICKASTGRILSGEQQPLTTQGVTAFTPIYGKGSTLLQSGYRRLAAAGLSAGELVANDSLKMCLETGYSRGMICCVEQFGGIGQHPISPHQNLSFRCTVVYRPHHRSCPALNSLSTQFQSITHGQTICISHTLLPRPVLSQYTQSITFRKPATPPPPPSGCLCNIPLPPVHMQEHDQQDLSVQNLGYKFC